jgi:hypothetical protein
LTSIFNCGGYTAGDGWPAPRYAGSMRYPDGGGLDGAERVGLSGPQITSLAHGAASDPCWTSERDRLLIQAADALHDTSDIDDDLWRRMAAEFSVEQLLDLLMLSGWYHAVSFTANAARVACEEGAPRFADVAARA